MTWLITVCRTGHAGFDKLAEYASISAVIYGTIAVTLELVGLIMFYTIGAIIKFAGDRKANQDAKALELMANNPALLERANEAARKKERETVGAK